MIEIESQNIIQEYLGFLHNKEFPCVGARAALAGQHIKCMVANHMACPKDDMAILQFLYDFVDDYRHSKEIFHSVAIVFKDPERLTEESFDELLWIRLQALADLDKRNYDYDKRVNADPSSVNFSFSLKEEAFFIIGLHPASSRPARQFKYPTLVFNPHAQFEKLKQSNSYETMKAVIRKRDIAFSGSVNPMLNDFGKSSEASQYSGRNYDNNWQCPLNTKHATINDNTSP
ncbi:MAG TPA: guanitoxin biosynthesis heme-dependent pre-guanitoxin N-hydroxylase GntA [Puia sp.]|nr:guanitoxin biosynthesis heme-dependent pre-guanitoxin N-hydroxylase GntA [Puia sp.]